MPKTVAVFLEELELKIAYRDALQKSQTGVPLTAGERALLTDKTPEEIDSPTAGTLTSVDMIFIIQQFFSKMKWHNYVLHIKILIYRENSRRDYCFFTK